MEPYYRDKLRTEFGRRCRRNPGYSLRAFAKDLDLHPGTLSAVIAGKRGLPTRSLDHVIGKLALTEKQQRLFKRSAVLRTSAASEDRQMVELEEAHHRLIAEWEYYALLNLVETNDFRPELPWVAARLGVSEDRATQVTQDLEEWGFLERRTGEWRRVSAVLKTTDDVASAALREAHRDELQLAARSLDEIPLHLREFGSVTFPMSIEALPKAKALIRKFREDLLACMESDQADQVYQLCIQLFPLTKWSEQDANPPE